MAGIADLVSAFAGGNAIENEAYAKQGQRILNAQNSQALLDKRIQEAVAAANEARYRQNFENVAGKELNIPDAVKYAILGGMGGDLKSSTEAIGAGKENEILGMIMNVIQQQQQSGAPPADLLNMMVGARDGKLLGPGNVQVQGQAQADLGKTIAETVAAIKLGDARGALADSRNTDPTTGGVPNTETVDAFSRDNLWANPDQLAVEVPVDIPFWPFDGSETKMLPFDDPLAQAAWAEKTPEERATFLQFLGPEFSMWREANIANDPSLKDTGIAIGKFLSQRGGSTANPPQRAVADQATQQSQQAQQARAEFQTPDELGAAIAAGVVQPGDVVMTPEGPKVVKAMQ